MTVHIQKPSAVKRVSTAIRGHCPIRDVPSYITLVQRPFLTEFLKIFTATIALTLAQSSG